MSNVCTRRPSAPVCLVTSTLPSIFSAKETASSTDAATFTPPWKPVLKVPLPRPPAWIWDLTTTRALPLAVIFSAAGAGFAERFGGDFERDGDAVFGEQLFGLIFVDIHFKI